MPILQRGEIVDQQERILPRIAHMGHLVPIRRMELLQVNAFMVCQRLVITADNAGYLPEILGAFPGSEPQILHVTRPGRPYGLVVQVIDDIIHIQHPNAPRKYNYCKNGKQTMPAAQFVPSSQV